MNVSVVRLLWNWSTSRCPATVPTPSYRILALNTSTCLYSDVSTPSDFIARSRSAVPRVPSTPTFSVTYRSDFIYIVVFRRPYNLYCVGADVKPCSINLYRRQRLGLLCYFQRINSGSSLESSSVNCLYMYTVFRKKHPLTFSFVSP